MISLTERKGRREDAGAGYRDKGYSIEKIYAWT